MLSVIEQFYEDQTEPLQSCFLSLRKIILDYDGDIKETWKYSMPFFYFKNKMFCYLYQQKGGGLPYIGFAKGRLLSHPDLELGNRKKMKVLTINPSEDLPIQTIHDILNDARKLY